MAKMNDEPAFPVDGTDFENLNNEDAKSLGYEVFVDDHTGKKMMRRLKLPSPWIKQTDNKGINGYYNSETGEFTCRRPGTERIGVFKKKIVNMGSTNGSQASSGILSSTSVPPLLRKYERMRIAGVPMAAIQSKMAMDKVPKNLILDFCSAPETSTNKKSVSSNAAICREQETLSAARSQPSSTSAGLETKRDEPVDTPLVTIEATKNTLSIHRKHDQGNREKNADIISTML